MRFMIFFHFFAYIQPCLITKRMLECASSSNHVIYPLPNQNLRDPQVEKKKITRRNLKLE